MQNESGLDRVIRVVLGVFALVSSFWLSGIPQIVVFVLGAGLFVTGITGYCGLYALLKVKTNR
jgi:hypothetical protein